MILCGENSLKDEDLVNAFYSFIDEFEEVALNDPHDTASTQ